MIRKYLKTVFLIFLLFGILEVQGQTTAPEAFRYQAIARTSAGIPITNQTIRIKLGIISSSPAGTLEWEETHVVSTDTNGLYLIKIGEGLSTGVGTLSSFSSIQWQSGNYYIKIEEDLSGGTSYLDFGTVQFFSVPYSFYSTQSQSVTNLRLNDLSDADTSGIQNSYILKWDGTNWKPAQDLSSDTVSFSYEALFSNQTDTTSYANNLVNPSDTVNFSFQTNTSSFSSNAVNSNNSIQSVNSDTATYAVNYLPYNWSVTGNTVPLNKFLGTNSNTDLVFKAAAAEVFRIDASGKAMMGATSSLSSQYFVGTNGFIMVGTFGSGSLPDSSYNTRLMWYPKKASARIGQISSNNWNDANIGNYSFGAGYNPKSSGLYSIAMGYNSTALSENCVSIGKSCSTDIVGVISNGGAIAFGDSCTVAATRSVAMGYKNRSDGGIVMGNKNRVYWASQTSAWGANLYNSGNCSIIMGTNAAILTSAEGAFVFADSSATGMSASVLYQTKIRASGGVVFYTDSSLTNGVQLFPGGGAWASVSDRNKKENFKVESEEEILEKITQLKITSWNYKSQSKRIRHIGPMAQDFHSIFGFGENETTICTVDIDGVALLGIKGLEKRTSDLNTDFESLDEVKAKVTEINDFSELENRVSKIEKELQNNNR
jgi:hypothetical protein